MVDGLRRGNDDNVPAFFAEAFAPVHVFAINEESFIEEPDLPKRRAPNEPETAAENVHLRRGADILMKTQIPIEQRHMRCEPVKRECAAE